jgi:hypothetical protein
MKTRFDWDCSFAHPRRCQLDSHKIGGVRNKVSQYLVGWAVLHVFQTLQ